jgi:hypothetical protein
MLRRVALVRMYVSKELKQPHGVTSQKTAFFMIYVMYGNNLFFILRIT